MKKFILLIILMVTGLCSASYAQDFEQIIELFGAKEWADVARVSGIMLKLASSASGSKGDVATKEFMKRINSMTMLDLERCSQADKEEFAKAIKDIQPADTEAIKQTELARVFFREGERRNELIVATYDGEAYFLTLMQGRFSRQEAINNIVTRKKSEQKE